MTEVITQTVAEEDIVTIPAETETETPPSLVSQIQFTDVIRVELMKTDFSDRFTCIAARTSTAGIDASEKANNGLINSLMKNRHGSPFEHTTATWRVTAPLFVWREHHRHRIASYNEESARYKQLEPRFYIPGKNRPLVGVGKAMDYKTLPGTPEQYYLVKGVHEEVARDNYAKYELQLRNGILREVARDVLPLSIMSTCIVTMNARALMNFLSLRVEDENSLFVSKPLYEIQLVAQGFEQTLKDHAPITHKAFTDNRRVAP